MADPNPYFEVIVGTYEEYLLAYVCEPRKKSIKQSVASHDHSGSIRALATDGTYLASGGADDRIIIYDLNRRKQHCILTHHESTITCLVFTNTASHLISAAQDGSLAMVRVGSWKLEKLWEKAHQGAAIMDIAIHPSSKLAFTLGNDCTLRTWNLVKGRSSYVINLFSRCKDPKSLDKIILSPDGSRFILQGGYYTEIWSIDVGGMLQVIKHDQKVTCAIWQSDNIICVGYENGQLANWEVTTKKQITLQQAHPGRVKAIDNYGLGLVTASSTGQIKVWDMDMKKLGSIETGCRITCLRAIELSDKLKKEKMQDGTEEVTVHLKKGAVIVETDTSSDEEQELRKRLENQKKQQLKRKKFKKKGSNIKKNVGKSVKDVSP